MTAIFAQLDFQNVLAVAIGVILGLAVLNTVRWLFLRHRRFRLPEEMLVEMNKFAERFQQAAEQMTALSRLMEDPSRRRWKHKNTEILRVLRQMNHLLEHLNEFFQEKVRNYENHSEDTAGLPTDFLGRDEEEKFRQMNRITEEEIARTDWDELLRRLQQTNKPTDTL